MTSITSTNTSLTGKHSTSKLSQIAKKIPWLYGILAVQLALAGLFFFDKKEMAPVVNEPLLTFKSDTITRLEITTDDQGSLTFTKKDNRWQMNDGTPAAEVGINELLATLTAMRTGWPIANSEEAAIRFKVDDKTFRRRITLFEGDKEVGKLFIGTSPTFKHSHGRVPGSKHIYSVSIDEYYMTAEADSWLDTTLMNLKAENIVAVQKGDKKIEMLDGKWPEVDLPAMAAPPTDNAQTNAANKAPSKFNSQAFVNTLAEFEVLTMVKTEGENNSTAIPAADVEWTVKTKDAELSYSLAHKDDEYYIQRKDFSKTFRISKPHYDSLIKIKDL